MFKQLSLFSGLSPLVLEFPSVKRSPRAEKILSFLSLAASREYQTISEREHFQSAWLMVNCAHNHSHLLNPIDCASITLYGSKYQAFERKLQRNREIMWGGEVPEPNLPPILPQKKPSASVSSVSHVVKAGAR
jgi:hypothetical protein